MARFRVPYPADPATRQACFQRAASLLARNGRYEGTTEQGRFEGSTPFGAFAGTYQAIDPTQELEIVLTRKPWFVTTHLLEREVRKLLAQM